MSNYKTSIRISLFIVTALLIGAALGIMLERAALRDTYTEVRRVKKPSGALPGKVIYTDYRTITVAGCAR